MSDCAYPANTVLSAYIYGCRCERCTKGNSEYQRNYRLNNPDKAAVYKAKARVREKVRRQTYGRKSKPRPTALARFKARCRIHRNRSGCWLWHGKLTNAGYGSFSWIRADGTRGYGAHCFAWEHYRNHGQRPPAGLELDHLCFNRRCCNPRHLEPVTRDENVRRMVEHTRAIGQVAVKLNQPQVIEIRKRYTAGESPTLLAREFGVVAQTIHDIVAKRTWKYTRSP